MNPVSDISDSFFKNLFDAIGGVFKRSNVSIEQALRDSVTFKHISREVVKSGNNAVDCFFLMMIHNGGNKIIPHGFIYRSIVGGYHEEWAMPRFVPENYKYIELNYEYKLLMGQLFRDKEVSADPLVMGDTDLSVKFQFEKICFARYFYLKSNKKGLWYVMVGTTQPNQAFLAPSDKHEISMALNKIKLIVKKYR